MTPKRNTLGFVISVTLACPLLAEETQHIEKVVIKGTKQEQTLISAPASVSVINKKKITQSGISQLRDIDELLPNVSISQIGQIGGSYISIRGVESNPFVVNRAAVYIDGIPYREPDNVNIRQARQVEVFKGPQSALYGANADAGIIVVNTATPDSQTQITLFSDIEHFSNGNALKAGVTISGEVVTDFFSTLDVERQKGDSYIKNIGADNTEQGEIDNVRLYSRSRYFFPNDGGELNINIMYNELRSPGLYEQEFAPLDVALYNSNYSALYNSNLTVDDFTLFHDAPKHTEEDEWSAGLSYKVDVADYSVFAAFAYRETEEDGYGNDLDLTLAPFAAGGNQVEFDYTNAEIRVANQSDTTLEWFAGLAYYKQNKAQNLYTMAGSGTLDDYQPAPTQGASITNTAAFGLMKYQISKELSAQAGLRYERSSASVSQQAGSLVLGSLVLDYVAADATKKTDVWLPQLALSWQPDQQQNLFISAAKGYLPGGFNLVAADKGDEIAEQYGPYEDETLWSYEVGYKVYSPENSLNFNGAVFYIDASSWQEVSILTAPDGTVLSTVLITSNAAITSQGAEMELSWIPIAPLSVNLGVGYTKAKYERNDYSDSVSYAGNRVKMIPEWDTSFTATYQWLNGLYLRGQWRLLGKTALTADNAIFRPTTHLFDAAIGYQNDSFQLRLFVENLSNERYAAGQAYENFMLGFDENYYAPLSTPRVFGLEVVWEL